MPQTINTNVASLNAQRNLNKSQQNLNVSLQRLSTGLRINSAKDDAAGLSISERFTTQIRGLNQAIRNANDGISLVQTAEGALGESVNALQRIRELAVQSANATNSASDRATLNTEIQQLISEVDRIATQTTFNGNQILSTNGGFNASFQIGANVGQALDVNVDSVLSTDVGTATNYNTIVNSSDAAIAARLFWQNQYNLSSATLNGEAIADAPFTDVQAKVQAVNNSNTGLTAFSYGNSLSFMSGGAGAAVGAGDILVNGVEIAGSDGTLADMAAKINEKSDEHGISAVVHPDVFDYLYLLNRDGEEITFETKTNNATNIVGNSATGVIETATAGQYGSIVLSAAHGQTTFDDAGTNAAYALTGLSGPITLTDTSLATVDVNSVSGANLAIIAADEAINRLNDNRSQLGAVQNRIESTIAALSSTAQNLTAARSRIQDADFAVETANLTKTQILQQAGISVLQQANSTSQNALALLG